jgi:hypothetical protein
VILDSALTDSEIRSNIFAGLTRENHLHDLPLASREASEVIGSVFAPFRELSGVMERLQSASNAGKQLNAVNRFLQKIGRTGLHGINRHRDVALSCYHDGRH